MSSHPAGPRIAEAIAAAEAMPAIQAATLRVTGVGWATVELDRAAQEFAARLETEPGAFEPAADDVALGGRCRLARTALPGDRTLVLLEPSTEGRLAATLARFGEGPAVIWFSGNAPDLAAATLGEAGVTLSATRDGPLGGARLLLGGPVHGPHRFLLAPRTGTIRK